MKDYEFKILSIAILGLCLLVVALGMKVETLQNESNSKQSDQIVPTIPDSISIGRDTSLEGLW